jgi:hypothetical protein
MQTMNKLLLLPVVLMISVLQSFPACQTMGSPGASKGLVYINNEYGFRFSLPKSWKGYTLVASGWNGRVIDSNPEKSEKGPAISIRHPLWTKENPRQDIPIMVFTHAQWQLIEKEELSVSAAPIGPSELGRNAKYVFALSARYNFAYLPGWEEVDQILQHKPLQAF